MIDWREGLFLVQTTDIFEHSLVTQSGDVVGNGYNLLYLDAAEGTVFEFIRTGGAED